MRNREWIKDTEAELEKGNGIVVFDMMCYFPYANQKDLAFDFGLGMEELCYKYNHRYPNKGCVTISKKEGRKVCKYGYPVAVPLDEEQLMICHMDIGIKDKTIKVAFPVRAKVTKEKPICGLTCRFDFDDGKLMITTYIPIEGKQGCRQKLYCNREIPEDQKEWYNEENYVVMQVGGVNEEKHLLTYDTLVDLAPDTLNHFYIGY